VIAMRKGSRSASLVVASSFFAAALFASTAHAEPRRLTVEDVVRMALSSHPRLAAARSHAESAHLLKKSAGGRMLPVLAATEEFQHYDSPFDIAFGGQTFRARDQDTNTATVSASQPVLGLLHRLEEYKAQARSADAADASVRVAEANAKEMLEVQYLSMFEANALEQIAHASESELAEEVTVTEARVKAGALTQADLLRVKVAQANARQQAIAARTQATVARAELLSAVGFSPADKEVEFVEPTTLLQAAPVNVASSETALIDARPEVERARKSAEAARHTARARMFGLLPEVDLEAAYARVDGQVFAPKDSAFVGVKAAWPFWEWGSSYHAQAAASAEAEAAEHDLENERRQVLVEVTSRRAELEAAVGAVELADETIKSAEEAYRVTDVQVRAGAATVTDLLDSQAALTQARLNLARARYQQAIARVELERAAAVH
jgi:outer membrane protein TolC